MKILRSLINSYHCWCTTHVHRLVRFENSKIRQFAITYLRSAWCLCTFYMNVLLILLLDDNRAWRKKKKNKNKIMVLIQLIVLSIHTYRKINKHVYFYIIYIFFFTYDLLNIRLHTFLLILISLHWFGEVGCARNEMF